MYKDSNAIVWLVWWVLEEFMTMYDTLFYSVLDNIPLLQWMNKLIAQDFDLDSALSLNQKMPYGHLSLVYESNYVWFQEIVC